MTWARRPRTNVHGYAHAKARKAAAQIHSPSHPCFRCGLPLGPMGPWLHYDHDDVDKTKYRGFSHAACNIRAGAELGRERQQHRREPPRSSRSWF